MLFTTHHAHCLLLPFLGLSLAPCWMYRYIFVIRRTSFQLEEYEPEQDLVRSTAAAACVFSWGKSETFCFCCFLVFIFTFCFIILFFFFFFFHLGISSLSWLVFLMDSFQSVQREMWLANLLPSLEKKKSCWIGWRVAGNWEQQHTDDSWLTVSIKGEHREPPALVALSINIYCFPLPLDGSWFSPSSLWCERRRATRLLASADWSTLATVIQLEDYKVVVVAAVEGEEEVSRRATEMGGRKKKIKLAHKLCQREKE